jgi:hypothetical protein
VAYEPLLPVYADGERGLAIGWIGAESGCELVERGAEAVHCVTDDDPPLDIGDDDVLVDFDQDLCALSIGLDNTLEPGISVFFPEGFTERLESVEVFCCPEDLLGAALKDVQGDIPS